MVVRTHKAYIYCKLQHGVKQVQARAALSLFGSCQVLPMEFSDKSLCFGTRQDWGVVKVMPECRSELDWQYRWWPEISAMISDDCYEIDKHTDIHPFIPSYTLHLSQISFSDRNIQNPQNSHLSTRNINDSINSSYYNDITPIPTPNDTNKSLGDRIYAAPISCTPSKLHICYRGLYFLFYHFIFTLLSLTL